MSHCLRYGHHAKGTGGQASVAWWRSARGLAGLLVAIICLGCGPQPLVQESAWIPDLHAVLAVDKAAYASGEPIQLTLEVANRGVQPVTLRFASAQRYDIVVQERQGREVWRWSSDKAFAQVLGEETLAAGGKLTYRISVRESLPPGHYSIIGILATVGERLSASTEIEIR